MKTIIVFLIFIFIFSINSFGEKDISFNNQIAFLADIHFQDINNRNNIKSMHEQVLSTRLFNENYFALYAALNDIADKGIKIVIILGDLTDNGQKNNVIKIAKILDYYHSKYGIRFFAITGNHDPSRPFNGKSSMEHLLGYKDILKYWKNIGFFPTKNDIYWETPFSDYQQQYSYEQSKQQSSLTNRVYHLNNLSPSIIDASYLVEPIPNLWIMAIDASVYLPQKLNHKGDSILTFKSSNIGYNLTLKYKPYLLTWIKKVCKQAQEQNKTLIVFSHYPLVDYYNGTKDDLSQIFSIGKSDLHRIPNKITSNTFADAGIKVHFAGHLHINHTGYFISDNGNSLINIQVPSISGYIPAYKILTIKNKNKWNIQTITLNKVKNFSSFFHLYKNEHKKDSTFWSDEILNAKNYINYTMLHLKNLVRLRYCLNDFPNVLKDSTQLIYDYYRIKNGGDYGIEHIGEKTIKKYKNIMQKNMFLANDTTVNIFLKVINKQIINKYPDKNFTIFFTDTGVHIK